MSHSKRVTIHDVARLAGVSHTTVSWVVHDDRRISAATKEKVHKAIKELNYHPNHMARSLVRGKSNTIAIVASFYTSAFETEIMRGIEQGFEQTTTNYGVVQYATRKDPERKNEVLQEIIFGRKSDAVICLNLSIDDDMVDAIVHSRVPVVLVETSKVRLSSVKSDSIRGGYLAARHLLERGRKRVGIVTGPLGAHEEGMSARDRYNGYLKALDEFNLAFKPEWHLELKDYYLEEGQRALGRIVDLGLDAVFCAAGDMVALGIMDSAKRRGVRIPEDLALVGYDNLVISSMVQPSLTTVSQPLQAMGLQAFQTCMDLLSATRGEAAHTVYQPELVVRQSS